MERRGIFPIPSGVYCISSFSACFPPPTPRIQIGTVRTSPGASELRSPRSILMSIPLVPINALAGVDSKSACASGKAGRWRPRVNKNRSAITSSFRFRFRFCDVYVGCYALILLRQHTPMAYYFSSKCFPPEPAHNSLSSW